MSALDQAFIKAYAKEPAQPAVKNTAEPAVKNTATPVKAEPARGPQGRAATSHIENIYAAGTLYRIETPRAAEPEPVPPPHFAARASRRMPLRYRLAQMDGEEIAAPVAKRQPPLVQPARTAAPARPNSPERVPEPKQAPSPKRVAAKIPAPPPLPPTPAAQPESPRPAKAPAARLELPRPAPAKGPVEEIHAVIEERQPTLDASNFAFNPVEVRQRWDELLGESPVVAESALAVWPVAEELAVAQASSLISLSLETIPEPVPTVTEVTVIEAVETGAPAASPAKTYRLDAAHAAVPAPHQPPQPTVEELIQPAEEPQIASSTAKALDRPPVISAEEAAELVGAPHGASPAIAAPAIPQPLKQLVPAWEVDRFLWPALCEKLLRDEHSYFVQAGGKIAAAVRDGLKSLAITGSRRGEGRTTLALCLARSAAAAGLKVAIVDADFARPQVAASFGLEIAASWHEAAYGKTTLSEVAIKSLEDNLTVLPLDVSTAAAPLSLADPRLTKTLREAASSFDLLVLDMGPTAAGSGPLFPDNEPPPADAAIVVRDLRYCTPAESQAIGERLCLSGIEAVGIAENFVPAEKLVA